MIVLRLGFLFFLFCMSSLAAQAAGERKLVIFAAASLREVLQDIGVGYEKACHCRIAFSFAASSTLARQVDAGAPADVFISANQAWTDWLQTRNTVNIDTQAIIAGNRLVIASAARTRDSFNILFRGRFAMADTRSVPAGIYGREALEAMGIWEEVKSNAVFSENVRVALASIRRGDLLSGIVYQSDLKLADDLHAHFVFPPETHSPVHYVAVAIKGAGKGKAFVDFLKSDEAQDALARFGFLPLSDTNQK